VAIKTGAFPALQTTPESSAARAPATSAVTTARQGARHMRPRLIVGPFAVQSADSPGEPIDSGQTDLIGGLRHQLIANLVRFREWSVVNGARGDVAVPNADSDQPQYLVDAMYVRSGDLVRIVLTLSDQRSGEFIWSEEHATNLDQWFSSQQLIVRRMAIALNVHISADRAQRLMWQPPDTALSVYDRWLQGEVLTQRWRLENRLQAVEIFEKIIDEVPDFAPAHFGIANFNNVWSHMCPGRFRTRERHLEALERAKTAVSLDPTNCRAHLCAAWSYAMAAQYDQAELSFQMAHQLNENDPWTLISSTLGLAFCGLHDEALARLNQVRELGLISTPLHWGYQASVLFLCEDYEGCAASAERTEDAIYNFPAWRTSALGHLGRIDEAQTAWRHFADMVRQDWHGERSPETGGVPDEAIVKWLLSVFPIRRQDDWERLRAGLEAAGVPVHTAEYGAP